MSLALVAAKLYGPPDAVKKVFKNCLSKIDQIDQIDQRPHPETLYETPESEGIKIAPRLGHQ